MSPKLQFPETYEGIKSVADYWLEVYTQKKKETDLALTTWSAYHSILQLYKLRVEEEKDVGESTPSN